MLDDREIQEAILVCFDTSSSMNGDAWEPDKEEGGITFTKAELEAELERFKDNPYLDFYRKLYSSTLHKSKVISEIRSQSVIMDHVCLKYESKVVEILQQPMKVPIPDPEETTDKVEEKDDGGVIPEPVSPLQIFVKTLTGKTITLTIDKNWMVSVVKDLINKRMGQNQPLRIIYAGKVLQDNVKVEEYGIQENSTLHVIFSFSNYSPSGFGGKKTITIKERGWWRPQIKLTVDSSNTVYYLKLLIWQKEPNEVPHRFSLWSNMREIGDGWVTGTLFRDNKKLSQYNLSDLIEIRAPHAEEDNKLSRLQTVQQLFNAFINRSQAYDYPNQIGLILFGSEVEYVCPITPLFEVFRDHIENADARGETKLWDAVKTAGEHLVKFSEKHKKAKLRVLCLSDGEDTKSKAKAFEVAQYLQNHHIICDCIMIGEGANNKELRSVAKATGGYAFAPQNLKQALKLNELETLLTIHERPETKIPPVVKSSSDLYKFADLWKYPLDECTDDRVPERKKHEKLNQPVQTVKKTLEKASTEESKSTGGKSQASRVQRLLKELTDLSKNPHPAIDIYPSQEDVGFWRLVMEAPEGSPYKGGTWLLYANFPDDYPLGAPEIRFITPIRHCNVNQYGKICHSIFTRNWSSDTSMPTVLSCIFGLLLNPDVDDPLDTGLALQYFAASGQYEASIMEHVNKHAVSKNRETWKKDLLKDE
eukprot:TRINITY_DN5139_c0_g2_i3.p1 TRINITY_DN5139_c0_g2~~TRINITY_DN5139_c0_g2_i3.p1  ORF type:complete len:704 (+),score=145.45 TRINITY_DN5139_c0_g2_i3:728-2839(+)